MKIFNFCKYEFLRKNWKFMYLFKVRIGKCNSRFLMVVFMLIIYKIDKLIYILNFN